MSVTVIIRGILIRFLILGFMWVISVSLWVLLVQYLIHCVVPFRSYSRIFDLGVVFGRPICGILPNKTSQNVPMQKPTNVQLNYNNLRLLHYATLRIYKHPEPFSVANGSTRSVEPPGATQRRQPPQFGQGPDMTLRYPGPFVTIIRRRPEPARLRHRSYNSLFASPETINQTQLTQKPLLRLRILARQGPDQLVVIVDVVVLINRDGVFVARLPVVIHLSLVPLQVAIDLQLSLQGTDVALLRLVLPDRLRHLRLLLLVLQLLVAVQVRVLPQQSSHVPLPDVLRSLPHHRRQIPLVLIVIILRIVITPLPTVPHHRRQIPLLVIPLGVATVRKVRIPGQGRDVPLFSQFVQQIRQFSFRMQLPISGQRRDAPFVIIVLFLERRELAVLRQVRYASLVLVVELVQIVAAQSEGVDELAVGKLVLQVAEQFLLEGLHLDRVRWKEQQLREV